MLRDFKKRIDKKWMILLWVLLFVSIFILRYFDSFLVNDITTNGIFSFEMARGLTSSERIIASWNRQDLAAVGLSLGFDFIFLIIYALLLYAIVHNLNRRLYYKKGNYKLGLIFLYLPFVAAFFDILENIALIQLLLNDLSGNWSIWASNFAMLKFLILVALLVYILFGYLLVVSRKK